MTFFPAVVSAEVIYDNWSSNNGANGPNYLLTVNEVAGDLDFDLTIDPWNAEALGLFIDLGDIDVVGASILGANAILFASDTADSDCGPGCNLNGGGGSSIDPTSPDGEWELVVRLADSGYQGIQSFSFTVDVPNVALTESMLGLIGARAQVLCPPGTVLPGGQAGCNGSDKSSGTPRIPPTNVSLPGSLALLGLGVIGLGAARRRRTR